MVKYNQVRTAAVSSQDEAFSSYCQVSYTYTLCLINCHSMQGSVQESQWHKEQVWRKLLSACTRKTFFHVASQFGGSEALRSAQIHWSTAKQQQNWQMKCYKWLTMQCKRMMKLQPVNFPFRLQLLHVSHMSLGTILKRPILVGWTFSSVYYQLKVTMNKLCVHALIFIDVYRKSEYIPTLEFLQLCLLST